MTFESEGRKSAPPKLDYKCAECGASAIAANGRIVVPHSAECAFGQFAHNIQKRGK